MTVWHRRRLQFAGAILSLLMAQSVGAEVKPASRIGDVASGKPVELLQHNEPITFAGQEVQFEDFSGLIGHSADLAYVVVADGKAVIDDRKAGRGQVIVIPAMSDEFAIQRFDAERLIQSRGDKSPLSAELTALVESIARGQSAGLFLGRLKRTNFNIAASGSAKNELARRSIVGKKVVRDFRYGGVSNINDAERQIVSRFMTALIDGDAESLSAMIDPLAFGATDLRLGGDEARQLMAKSMIAERNWRDQFAGFQVEASNPQERQWRVLGRENNATIKMRSTTDFSFINSISVGE